MRSQKKRMYPPLVLAYVGDAVFESHIRTYLVGKHMGNANKLHRCATKYVKASAQAASIHGIREMLSDEEWMMVKKGRNQKSNTMPKNATVSDYRYATGFETLIGYLHMSGEQDRIKEIVEASIAFIENKAKER